MPPPAAASCNIYLNQYSAYNSNTNYNNQYQYQPANNGYVINWTSSNANYGFINNGIGSIGLSGNRTVYPTQTTVYTATFTGQNNQTVTCSVTVNVNTYVPPVYQNPVPYVTLAAVPYTGLDLGPVGTVLYWGFLVLWCLGAAYLIAVKRVHMKIYRWYKKALFGEEIAVHATHTAYVAHAVVPASGAYSQTELTKLAAMLRTIMDGAPAKADTVATVTETDGVDSFIMSQIHRGQRA